MRYAKLIYLISLHLFACSSYQSTDRTSAPDALFPPLSILTAYAKIIDTRYIITGYTNSIPPHYIKKTKNLVYEVTLSIKVNGINTYWRSHFEVVLILPNGENINYVLNEEEFALSSSFIEDFKFIVETPQKGVAKCKISFENQPRNGFGLIDYNWHLFDLN